jgi:hypothetical protein
VNWLDGRWHDLTGLGSATWLAIAAWAAVALGAAALIYAHQQIQRNRQLVVDQTRPHVVMFMEPNAADWHLIELVVKNFGQLAAHDIRIAFPNPPTVARYESGYGDGVPEVEKLQLPRKLPILAPGQEWRTVWDSAMDRNQLGESIDSRFDGTLTYSDAPPPNGRWRKLRFGRQPRSFQTPVVLDWNTLQPVERLELLTTHDLAKRERQKLELLRSLLTYFHYATKESRPDVMRAEIERINHAAKETQDRLQTKQIDEATDVLQWVNGDSPSGRHYRQSG